MNNVPVQRSLDTRHIFWTPRWPPRCSFRRSWEPRREWAACGPRGTRSLHRAAGALAQTGVRATISWTFRTPRDRRAQAYVSGVLRDWASRASRTSRDSRAAPAAFRPDRPTTTPTTGWGTRLSSAVCGPRWVRVGLDSRRTWYRFRRAHRTRCPQWAPRSASVRTSAAHCCSTSRWRICFHLCEMNLTCHCNIPWPQTVT